MRKVTCTVVLSVFLLAMLWGSALANPAPTWSSVWNYDGVYSIAYSYDNSTNIAQWDLTLQGISGQGVYVSPSDLGQVMTGFYVYGAPAPILATNSLDWTPSYNTQGGKLSFEENSVNGVNDGLYVTTPPSTITFTAQYAAPPVLTGNAIHLQSLDPGVYEGTSLVNSVFVTNDGGGGGTITRIPTPELPITWLLALTAPIGIWFKRRRLV